MISVCLSLLFFLFYAHQAAKYPLPFKDGIFDSVFTLDAVHYVNSRAQLASEMERILVSQGLLLLLHLHNSLTYNRGAGMPLSPSSWANLFHQIPVKALPERKLIEDFILGNKLDLAGEYTGAELNSSNAICLLGTRDGSLLKVYDEVKGDFLSNKNNLIINPIYRINREEGKLILRRQFPSQSFRKEYPLSEKYLPERYIINGELPKIIKGRTLSIASNDLSQKDLHHIEDLMMKFIVINVPEKYY